MKAKNAAMALLARREHSRAELTRKLVAKNFDLIEINAGLDELISQNYLSETRFIECMIRWRVFRGMGPLKIISELQYNHNIEKSAILNSEAWFVVDWLEKAQALRQRKYGDVIPTKPKERVAQLRFLQQRGFTLEQIQKIIKQ